MRLPKFVKKISPIGETLEAMEAGMGLLAEEAALRNRQLSVGTAEGGLSLWERDYDLPSDGDTAARRTRIRTTLTGGQTLTVEELKKLALTVGGADDSVVTEKFGLYQVILSALFDGGAPEDLSALEEAVARRSPAHLHVRVQTILPAKEVVYHGTVMPLSAARRNLAAVDVGDYILFAGGFTDSYAAPMSTVDAYDANLVRTAAAPLSAARLSLNATKAGKYAIVCGGHTGSSVSNIVDAYDEDLVRTSSANLSVGRDNFGTAKNESYGLIGGGSTGTYTSSVEAYDGTLTKTTCVPLSAAASSLAGSSVGQYALFAGGLCKSNAFYNSAAVDAYGEDLTKVVLENLSVARSEMGGAKNERYALFGGGSQSNSNLTVYTAQNAVDIYDETLTKGTAMPLSAARGTYGSCLDGYGVFLCGAQNSSLSAATDIYDNELTRKSEISFATARTATAVASNFDFLLTGGGDAGTYTDSVEALTAI